jgi:hypothetical protein
MPSGFWDDIVLDDERKEQLVKDVLYWLVSDVRALHHATGLFEKDLNEMNRISRIMRGRAREHLNTTAHVSSSTHSRLFNDMDDHEPSFEEATITAIKQAHQQLVAMDVPELESQLDALVQQNKDQKEADRLFNWDENQLSRLTFWVRKSIWSPKEAILIFGHREPKPRVIDYLDQMSQHERDESPFASAYFETLEPMESAIAVGEISSPGRPLEYLTWYEHIKSYVDEELRLAILEIHDPANTDLTKDDPSTERLDLSDLEQRSLLKLVATMAVKGYSFDPNAARNDSTSEIQSDADLLGLELDQKTILKWLRKACKLIPEDTSQRNP